MFALHRCHCMVLLVLPHFYCTKLWAKGSSCLSHTKSVGCSITTRVNEMRYALFSVSSSWHYISVTCDEQQAYPRVASSKESANVWLWSICRFSGDEKLLGKFKDGRQNCVLSTYVAA